MSEYTTVIGIIENEDRIEDARSLFNRLSTPRRKLYTNSERKTVASRMGKDHTDMRDEFAQALQEPYLIKNTNVFEPIAYRRLFVFHYETVGCSYQTFMRTEEDPFTDYEKSDKADYEWIKLPRLFPRDYNHHPSHCKLIENISSVRCNFLLKPY